MGYIAVDNLKQGMVLSEDVRDINARLLLSKGQKLVSNHIRVLKIWGIPEVKIAGAQQSQPFETAGPDSEKADRVKKEVGLVFQNLDLRHKLLNEICRCILIYRLHGDFVSVPPPESQAVAGDAALEDPDQIRQRIQKIEAQLPEAPTIITELNQVIGDPFATSNDVAQVVNKSPSLAALLLKIVNSAYYGFPSKVDRISRAVTIIGTKEISGLALGISVMQAFTDIPKNLIDMPAFIRHSLACGMISRILAAQKNLDQTEPLFVSGLLHDIGKLIVLKYYPHHARAYIQKAIDTGCSVYDCEKSTIGAHHTQVGKYLLNKWRLPLNLENNILYHHAPCRAQKPIEAGIVHLADLIAHGLGIGASGERMVPCFDSAAVDQLGLSPSVIETVIRQATHQLGPIDAIFRN